VDLHLGLDDQEFEEFCTDLLNLHPVIALLKDGKGPSHSSTGIEHSRTILEIIRHNTRLRGCSRACGGDQACGNERGNG
jgi:hypothetical protein